MCGLVHVSTMSFRSGKLQTSRVAFSGWARVAGVGICTQTCCMTVDLLRGKRQGRDLIALTQAENNLVSILMRLGVTLVAES